MTIKLLIFIFISALFSGTVNADECENRHISKAGDTLVALAEEYYGEIENWVKIVQANPSLSLSETEKIPLNTQLLIPCVKEPDNLIAQAGTSQTDRLDELLSDGISSVKQKSNPSLEELLAEGIAVKNKINKPQSDPGSTSDLELLLNEGMTDSPAAVSKTHGKTLPIQQTKNLNPAKINVNVLEDLLEDGISGSKTERDVVLRKPDKAVKDPEHQNESVVSIQKAVQDGQSTPVPDKQISTDSQEISTDSSPEQTGVEIQPELAHDEQIELEIKKLKSQLQQTKEQARQEVEAQRAKTQLLEKRLTEIENQKRQLQTSLKNQALSEIERLNQDVQEVTTLTKQEISTVINKMNEIEQELIQARELNKQASESLPSKQATNQLQTNLDKAKSKALQTIGSDNTQISDINSHSSTQKQFTQEEHDLMDSDEYDSTQKHLIHDVMSTQVQINQQEPEFTGGYERFMGNYNYVPEQDFIRSNEQYTQSLVASGNMNNELVNEQYDSENSFVSDLRSSLSDTIRSLNLKLSTHLDTNTKDYAELKLQIETLEQTFAKLDEIATIELKTEKQNVGQLNAKLSQARASVAIGLGLQKTSQSIPMKSNTLKSEKQTNSCEKFPNLCRNLSADQ